MKLKEYLLKLHELAEERPELLECDVVTAGDDEGNWYTRVFYTPSIGHLTEMGDWSCEADIEEMELDGVNAVCLN